MTKLSKLAIEKLDALGIFHDQPRSLQVQDAQAKLQCDVRSADRLSCAIEELHLAFPQDSFGKGGPDEHAERLCRRVTYLLEPLDVIETDPLSHQVLVRSSTPQRDQNTRSYYELRVEPAGNFVLRRFSGRRAMPRCSTPIQLTKEVLAKLIDDLVAVLD